MREIKFRGKRLDNGLWLYGDLLTFDGEFEILDHNTIDGTRYEVIQATVGQFTGLKDKNGKEIYEGDIIKELNGLPQVVKWSENGYLTGLIYKNTKFYSLGIEVIGNIHDNKELLKYWKRI